ncbi:GRIN2B [Cordylochernes scorpioides]|uniref:GRIN2B n=1 Tax=Cordylochernes scorpioides TaxID=51811 RepID=A0ABY6LFH8_9ARAC|nr:GRIN2B [Cordylochernes scorpioides]
MTILRLLLLCGGLLAVAGSPLQPINFGVILPKTTLITLERRYNKRIWDSVELLSKSRGFNFTFGQHFKLHSPQVVYMSLAPNPTEILSNLCTKLLSKDVVAVLYFTNSEVYGSNAASAQYILQLMGYLGIPVIAWNADNIGLEQRLSESRVLQLAPSVEHQSAAMLSILKRYSWHQFSVVTTHIGGHDDFVRAIRDQATAMQDYKFTIIDIFVLKGKNRNELRTELDVLANSEARIILLYCIREEAIEVMAAAEALGMTDRNYVWIVTQSAIKPSMEYAPPEFPPGMLGIHFNTTIDNLLGEIERAILILGHGLDLYAKDPKNNVSLSLNPNLSCNGSGDGRWNKGDYFFKYLRNVSIRTKFNHPNLEFNADGTLKHVELDIMNLNKKSIWDKLLLHITTLAEKKCNINGLCSTATKIKLEEIMERAEKQKIQIIALQETKLNEKYNLKYKNYNILRKDRNKEGGGLAFLIKNLYYEDIAINIPNTSDLEAQGIKVYLSQNKTINIFNMYHPPNNKLIDDGTMAQFLTDNTIIVGDLNAKHQLWGCSMPNPRGKILSNLFDDNAFMCLNDGNPTHHSYSYNTAQALDISFSSPDIFHKCKWQILKSIGSDHLPILIEISTKSKTSSIKEKFWNFKKANWNLYQQNTNEDFRKAPTSIKDLEQNWISFKNTIIKAAKVSIPRGNIKKWIPNYTHQAKDIQTLITKRNELQKSNSYQISSKIKFEIKDKKVEKKARKIIHDCKNITSTHNIFHEKINMKELDYALENTDLNKTPGPDGIHGQMISNLGKNGKERLLDIFNNSWKTGKLPQDWKTATIIPIKKLDKSADDPKNYRPISLTSICCKLMEKIILRRLTYHLDTKNLLPEEQYGFRKGHGTIDQVLFFTQKVKDAQNRKPTNHTIAAFLDLTQDFDKVWKNKLITKLYKHFKINGKAITWINDFLKNRYIRVKFNGTLSKTFKLYQGLPQGSVLSPTLFTLFIAGIEEKISHKTNIGLFADDIILWSSNTNWKKAERDLNKTLLHLEKFANKHKLEFNPQKSETCLFTTDKKLYKIRPKIILKEQQLQYNKHPKYLGYTLDPEINSSKHIEEVIRKGRDRLKILKYISGREWGADATTLKLTYTSLIRPILEYGYQIYGTASETNLKSLERIQLSAARIITGLRNTCPNDIVLYEADIMPLKDRRSYNLPKYINKIKSYGNKHRTFNYILNWESNLRLKKEGPLHLAKRNGFLKYKVKKNYLAEKISPCEPLQNVIFNASLNEPTNKQCQNPEYLKQLSLEIINNIPKNAITIYTDGSRDELGHTGSGCLIKTTNGIEKMNRRNPDFCSVFRSELIAIYEALKSIRNTNYQDIWILTDSRSAIQHLSHTGELRDKVSRNIIGYLQKLSKTSKIHLQWIPSHVGIEGNEAADVLAKKGTKEPLPQKNKLTFKEIETVAKTKINKNWRIPPKHSWYSGVNPGGALNIRNRQHQTTLTRFRTGHLKPLKIENNNKIYPTCPKCSLAPAAPEHILACIRCTKQDLWERPLLIIKQLEEHELMEFIGVWTEEGQLEIKDIVWPGDSPVPPAGVPEKFNLVVTFMEEPPYINLVHPDNETGECETSRAVRCLVASGNHSKNYMCCSGFCVDLLQKFANDLKFTYNLYRVEDGVWGIYKNNAWNGLIKEILSGRADLAVTSLKINSERQTAVDFTVPFMETGIAIAVMKKTGIISPKAFLEPFDTISWLMILILSIQVAALAIFFFEWISPYGYNMKMIPPNPLNNHLLYYLDPAHINVNKNLYQHRDAPSSRKLRDLNNRNTGEWDTAVPKTNGSITLPKICCYLRKRVKKTTREQIHLPKHSQTHHKRKLNVEKNKVSTHTHSLQKIKLEEEEIKMGEAQPFITNCKNKTEVGSQKVCFNYQKIIFR